MLLSVMTVAPVHEGLHLEAGSVPQLEMRRDGGRGHGHKHRRDARKGAG